VRRVYWTLDLLEAHVVADFLRAHDIDAKVFDADFVRQDWLASLAYGGFGVVAPADQYSAAMKLIDEWRANAFALEPEAEAVLTCPRCRSQDVVEDPTPRRIASAFLFFLMIPGIPFKRSYACRACDKRWRGTAEQSFGALARAADAAESAS
jgi:hypothetical protein